MPIIEKSDLMKYKDAAGNTTTIIQFAIQNTWEVSY